MSWEPPPRPSWVDDLVDGVERAFAVVGSEAAWPDPWPDREVPQEAYSRLEHPEKYLVLDSRVASWAAVLVERGLATERSGATSAWVGATGVRGGTDSATPAGQRVLLPSRSGALALTFVHHSARPGGFGIDVGVVARGEDVPVLLAYLPDCGCDACDSGSADLLAELDDVVLTVLRGGVVHARAGRDSATRTFHGWGGSGACSPDWLDDAVPAPPGVRRWVGEPWL